MVLLSPVRIAQIDFTAVVVWWLIPVLQDSCALRVGRDLQHHPQMNAPSAITVLVVSPFHSCAHMRP